MYLSADSPTGDDPVKEALPLSELLTSETQTHMAADGTESSVRICKYQLRKSEAVNLAEVFGQLSELQRSEVISHFEVRRASLEQVFAHFASFQVNRDPDNIIETESNAVRPAP